MASGNDTGDDFYCDVPLTDTSSLEVVHDGVGVPAHHRTRPYWPVHASTEHP